MSGRTHSEVTKKIISDALTGDKNPMFGKTGENNPMFGKTGKNHPMYGKNLSDKTKQIMSDAKKGENNPMYNKPRPQGAGNPSQVIEVTDITNNTTTSYDSIREAARALNIHKSVIDNYFKRDQKKPYKGQYTFKKI